MYKCKEDILKDLYELELTDFGDFKIKDGLVEEYEIIDFHCYLYNGLKSFLPPIFRKESIDFDASFFDLFCYPISLKYFDFNKELFTTYPAFNHSFSIVSVLRATVNDIERKNIFGENAKRLLKINC